MSKHQKKTTQMDLANKKRARKTKGKDSTHKPTMLSSPFDPTTNSDTNNNNSNSTNRNEKGNLGPIPRTGVSKKRKIHPRSTQPTTWNHYYYRQPSMAPPYPFITAPYPSLPSTSTYFVHHGPPAPPASAPAPFILPPNPLFPSNSNKKNTHWTPPDLYF